MKKIKKQNINYKFFFFNKLKQFKKTKNIYFVRQKNTYFKYNKYKSLIGQLIKNGQKLNSLFIFLNLLKLIKLNFNFLKSFIIFCYCLNKINPYFKYKIFYHSGKKHMLPMIITKYQSISNSFYNILKFIKEKKKSKSIVKELNNEIVDIYYKRGKSYNYVYKEWYPMIQESRRLLYLFESRLLKKNVYIKKKLKKKLKRKRKQWLKKQYYNLMYLKKYKKKKYIFKKTLLLC